MVQEVSQKMNFATQGGTGTTGQTQCPRVKPNPRSSQTLGLAEPWVKPNPGSIRTLVLGKTWV